MIMIKIIIKHMTWHDIGVKRDVLCALASSANACIVTYASCLKKFAVIVPADSMRSKKSALVRIPSSICESLR